MDENEKFQVLLSLLNIRQDNLKVMRERVFNISSTTITLYVLFVGWMVQKSTPPTLSETIFLVSIMIMFGIGNLLILRDIRRGFINTHKTLVRVEEALQLYKPNVFTNDDNPLLPYSMQKPLTGSHFRRFEYLLLFTAITSIAIVILKFTLS